MSRAVRPKLLYAASALTIVVGALACGGVHEPPLPYPEAAGLLMPPAPETVHLPGQFLPPSGEGELRPLQV